jgi:hypothetical protein
MLAVGSATTSFASSAAAGLRVSVNARDGPYRLVPQPGSGGSLTPRPWPSLRGRSRDPRSALSLFGSLSEAAAPCLRKRLDPRMGPKGAQKVTDVVADGFAA